MIDFHLIQTNNKSITIELTGTWDKTQIATISSKAQNWSMKIKKKHIIFDLEQVNSIDSSGAILIHKLIYNLKDQHCTVTVKNLSNSVQTLYDFYEDNFDTAPKQPPKEPNILYKLGVLIIQALQSGKEFLTFLGQTSFFFLYALIHPTKIRYRSIIHQIHLVGINALGIIGLTTFLVGLVLAYQGAEQLQKFGANIFIVEMISLSLFRELAPMITAIVIAGRSASSFTAQIGTMKITEEIDAMRTMGFEPSIFLVMPRILALMIAMPLLVFFANFLGLLGGMIVANYHLDISYFEFVQRMYQEVDIKHFIIGLCKAPIFGITIALIGCFRGFQVTGSTDSIGKFTTISVVNAIFWVIAINALISVLLTEIGI